MYGNDESHKRAARRRLQRLALAAALVASTATAASAIEIPGTPATASDAASPSLPPLPVNIGRLGTGASPAVRIAPSAVKGIRQNPFLIPSTATEGVVARVSGTDTEVAAMPESAPRLLRPTAPVLSLRPITPPADQPTDQPLSEDGTAEAPRSRGARFTLGDDIEPTTAHSAPRADHAAPSAFEEAPFSPAGGRVSFAISDDGVRATATLGQPDNAHQADELRSHEDQAAERAAEHLTADESVESAPDFGASESSDGMAADDQIPRLTSRTPRIVAAEAPAFALDLPEPDSDAADEMNEEMAAAPEAILDTPEPLDAPQSVLSVASDPEAAATATLARPSARISAVADRQPVVIAKPATPVGRRLPERETAAAAPPATSIASPPQATLAKPDRALVIDAPAGRPVAHVGGNPEFQLPQLADLPADRTESPDRVPTSSEAPVGSAPASRNEMAAPNQTAAPNQIAARTPVALGIQSAGTESGGIQSASPTSEPVGAGESVAATNVKTVVAEAILIQSAETRTITPAEPVRRVRLEDREICEAVLVGPHKLLLIGRRDGTTRLSVWSSDQREPALYEITVVSRQAAPSQSPLHAVALRLTETIAATYPHCQVQIVPAGDGLKVNGRVDSDDSAREIMRLVRRACLKSVTDNLEIR